MTKQMNQTNRQQIKGFLIAVLLVIFFATSFLTSAQQARELTLKEAIEIAKKQSPGALIAKHTFLADYWKYRSFKATYLPSLTFFGTLPNYDKSVRTIPTEDGDVFSAQTNNSLYGGLSLSQRLPFTGGSLSLNSNVRRLENINTFTDTTTTQFSATLINIAYTQSLFQYNDARFERRIEPMKYQEARKKYIENMEGVSMTTTNFFFNLLRAQIELEIAKINQANYDTLYKIAVGRYNMGKIAENDLLQLELQHLRSNANLSDAILDLEDQLFRFKSFLRIQDTLNIKLIIPDKFKPFKVSTEKALTEARLNNSAILGFKREMLEAESQVAQAKLIGWSNSEISAAYGKTNNTDELVDLNTNPIDLMQFRLGLTIPILDWGMARGQVKMAESNLELTRTSIEQDQVDFDQEVFLLVAKFNMQYDQIMIAAKSDTVAQKGYEITKARYLIGRISITDLNIAQAEANSSKSNYINALRTYWSNYYQLRRTTLFDFEKDMPIMVNFEELL